jgi:hypothetical protein
MIIAPILLYIRRGLKDGNFGKLIFATPRAVRASHLSTFAREPLEIADDNVPQR